MTMKSLDCDTLTALAIFQIFQDRQAFEYSRKVIDLIYRNPISTSHTHMSNKANEFQIYIPLNNKDLRFLKHKNPILRSQFFGENCILRKVIEERRRDNH